VCHFEGLDVFVILFLGADVVDETKVMGSPLFLQLNAGEMKRKYASEKLEDTDDG
jgi:hypothetical protein